MQRRSIFPSIPSVPFVLDCFRWHNDLNTSLTAIKGTGLPLCACNFYYTKSPVKCQVGIISILTKFNFFILYAYSFNVIITSDQDPQHFSTNHEQIWRNWIPLSNPTSNFKPFCELSIYSNTWLTMCIESMYPSCKKNI